PTENTIEKPLARRHQSGRSRAVRQRILIPPFPGSNPGAPATISPERKPMPRGSGPVPIERQSVRAILLTREHEVLLLAIRAPDHAERFWITPGGGLEPGETRNSRGPVGSITTPLRLDLAPFDPTDPLSPKGAGFFFGPPTPIRLATPRPLPSGPCPGMAASRCSGFAR